MVDPILSPRDKRQSTSLVTHDYGSCVLHGMKSRSDDRVGFLHLENPFLRRWYISPCVETEMSYFDQISYDFRSTT